jgi:hypothetical protein
VEEYRPTLFEIRGKKLLSNSVKKAYYFKKES